MKDKKGSWHLVMKRTENIHARKWPSFLTAIWEEGMGRHNPKKYTAILRATIYTSGTKYIKITI